MAVDSLARPARLLALAAALGLLLPAACGESPGASTATPTGEKPFAAVSAAPPALSATPAPEATVAPEATTEPSSGGVTEPAEGQRWQATEDETAEGRAILDRLLVAINTRDLSAAPGLVASDTDFHLEDVTNRVRRISSPGGRTDVVADEEAPAHLGMTGSWRVRVVALDGSDLASGSYTMTIDLRRESRRDEWRISSLELRPL